MCTAGDDRAMRRLALIAATTSALALSGCSSFSDGVADGLADSSNASQEITEIQDRFLLGLRSIDSALSENPDRALGRAENVCADIAAGKGDEAVVENVRQRFTGGTVTVDQYQARQIVELARMTVC